MPETYLLDERVCAWLTSIDVRNPSNSVQVGTELAVEVAGLSPGLQQVEVGVGSEGLTHAPQAAVQPGDT